MKLTSNRYQTVLVIFTGLSLAAWIFDLPILAKVGAVTGVVSILFPGVAGGIERGWFGLAKVLGWINARLLLGLIFFGFLLPIAWISRRFTNDPLALKRASRTSMYVVRNHRFTKEDLKNIW